MNEVVFTKAEETKEKFIGTLENGDYVAEIWETEDAFEAYLYKKNNSIKMFMEGYPKTNVPLGAAIENFKICLTEDDFIERYNEDYVRA